MRAFISSTLVVVVAAFAGCGGGGGRFTFDSLQYPVSMSAFVNGEDGTMVNKNDLRVIGKVEVKERFWGILYGWVDITGDVDVGDRINEQIKKKGGDAVINLAASASHCSINSAFFLNWWPVWPGCVNGAIGGQIVKYSPRAGSKAGEGERVSIVTPDRVNEVATELLKKRVNELVAKAPVDETGKVIQ